MNLGATDREPLAVVGDRYTNDARLVYILCNMSPGLAMELRV